MYIRIITILTCLIALMLNMGCRNSKLRATSFLQGLDNISTDSSTALRQYLAKELANISPHTLDTTFAKYLAISDVVYNIEPVLVKNHRVFLVTMAFKTYNTDSTWIASFTFGNIQHHEQYIYNMQLFVKPDSSVTIQQAQNSFYPIAHKWRGTAFVGRTVFVRYALIQDSLALHSIKLDHPYPIILRPNDFFVHRNALLLVPATDGNKWNDQKRGSVTILWKNMPLSWHWLNSFGADDTVQTYKGDMTRFIIEGIFCGGEIALTTATVGNSQVQTAVLQGNEKYAPEVMQWVGIISQAERSFMHSSTATAPYQGIIVPVPMKREDFAAFAYETNFMALLPNTVDSSNALSLKHTLAHEIFHSWNRSARVMRGSTGFDLYFTEGFTDYFARKILLKTGLITFQEYLQHYNKSIWNYYTSEYKNIKSASFGSSGSYTHPKERVAYWKGDILAHNWNAEIEQRSNGIYSFDDVMQQLLISPALITAESFAQAMKPYIGRDVMPEIEHVMRDGGDIEPSTKVWSNKVESKKIITPKKYFIVTLTWAKVPQYVIREQ